MSVTDYLGLLDDQAGRVLGHPARVGSDGHRIMDGGVRPSRRRLSGGAAVAEPCGLASARTRPVDDFHPPSGRLPDPLPDTFGNPLAVAGVTGLVQRRGLAQVTPQTIRLHGVPAALLRDRDTA